MNIIKTDSKKSSFFGYYDRQIKSSYTDQMIWHEVGFSGRNIEKSDSADILLGNADGNAETIGSTSAFNWQMGSNLQWLANKYVIWNDIHNGSVISHVYHPSDGSKKTGYPPVYEASKQNLKYLSLKPHRHIDRLGYDYVNAIPERGFDKSTLEADELVEVHIDIDGQYIKKNIFDNTEIEFLNQFAKGKRRFLDHPKYSPSEDKILFYLRVYSDLDRFETFAFIKFINTNEIYEFPRVGFYSHACWWSNEEVIIWSANPKYKFRDILRTRLRLNKYFQYYKSIIYLLKSLRTPPDIEAEKTLASANLRGCSYLCYRIGDKRLSLRQRISSPYGDGHPIKFDNEHFLTDTYELPDQSRRLLKVNYFTGNFTELGKFHSVLGDSANRCDLHPKIDEYRNIYIDLMTGIDDDERGVCVIE